MAERKPVHEYYDAVIDLGAAAPGGSYAAAIIKVTYWLGSRGSRCSPAPALPLENDVRDPALDPRVPPHTDFWPHKAFADVGVIGSAYAPPGRPVQGMRAGIEIAGRAKYVDVFGDRTVEWSTGRPRITAPQPFEKMPLDHRHAYGGVDLRVPFAKADPRAMGITLDSDHPGIYPRNPWGKGYIASPEPLEGFHLPNLEDPSDRLTDERVIATPELWYRQPLPWYLDWMPINCFPRCMFVSIDCDPWFPPPDDATLAEVRYGILPNGYRTVLKDQGIGMPPAWQFRQEAAHGLVLPNPFYGAPIRLTGMHPEQPVIECTVPEAPPTVYLMMEQSVERVEPQLTTLAIYPERGLLTMTYTASRPTPRPFIPGIHKHIPIAVSVNGDTPIAYQAPQPVREKLKQAQKGSGS